MQTSLFQKVVTAFSLVLSLGKCQCTLIGKNIHVCILLFKGDMSDSVTNYNYVGNTKVSVSIKETNANKCTLSEIFLTEILKSFSVF